MLKLTFTGFQLITADRFAVEGDHSAEIQHALTTLGIKPAEAPAPAPAPAPAAEKPAKPTEKPAEKPAKPAKPAKAEKPAKASKPPEGWTAPDGYVITGAELDKGMEERDENGKPTKRLRDVARVFLDHGVDKAAAVVEACKELQSTSKLLQKVPDLNRMSVAYEAAVETADDGVAT